MREGSSGPCGDDSGEDIGITIAGLAAALGEVHALLHHLRHRVEVAGRRAAYATGRAGLGSAVLAHALAGHRGTRSAHVSRRAIAQQDGSFVGSCEA